MKQQWKISSPVGPLYLVASEQGLCGLYNEKQAVELAKGLDSTDPAIRHLAKAAIQIEEYFAGKRHEFDVRLDLEGTPFQKRVWDELLKIPYGETRSYSDIAKNIRNAKAVRAVGSANGKNPVCIIVPCHRVIAADGSLGGYAGGLPMKTKLLGLETHHKSA